MLLCFYYSILLEYNHTNTKEAHVHMQKFRLKVKILQQICKIEVITKNELHCMSGNLFNVVLKHLQGDTQTTY